MLFSTLLHAITNVYRRAGAQVGRSASIKNDAKVNVNFVDERGRFLPLLFEMTWFPGMNERRAYFEALCAFDKFEHDKVNQYNLRVALFVARNRITSWANGFLPAYRPINEPFESLIPLSTIRSKAAGIHGAAISAAYQDLLATPAYTLFPGLPIEEAPVEAPANNEMAAGNGGDGSDEDGQDSNDADDEGGTPVKNEDDSTLIPGRGKTYFIATLAVARTCANRKIACQAPTNAATTVFFDRYLSSLDGVQCKHHFLAIHHYPPHIEIAIVLRFLRSHHGKEEWKADPHYTSFTETSDTDVAKWGREGSAAAAILFVLGKIDDFPCGREILAQVRRSPLVQDMIGRIEEELAAQASRELLQGDTDPEDFVVNDDEDDKGVAHGAHNPNDQLQDESVRATLGGKSLGGLVKALLVQIYWKASAIFSTTHVAASPVVRKFTKTANEFFLDEAGSATLAETLQLWRMDRRIVLAGDPKQLVLATLSAGARYQTAREAHSLNPLAPQHMLSGLYYGMINSFPVFVLRVQRRMVRGLFNLSKDLFYNRLGASSNSLELSYSETSETSSGEHDLSLSCEACASRMLNVRPTSGGRILPIFINVSGTQVQYTAVFNSTDVLIRLLKQWRGSPA